MRKTASFCASVAFQVTKVPFENINASGSFKVDASSSCEYCCLDVGSGGEDGDDEEELETMDENGDDDDDDDAAGIELLKRG
jgi:hypothetical protein